MKQLSACRVPLLRSFSARLAGSVRDSHLSGCRRLSRFRSLPSCWRQRRCLGLPEKGWGAESGHIRPQSRADPPLLLPPSPVRILTLIPDVLPFPVPSHSSKLTPVSHLAPTCLLLPALTPTKLTPRPLISHYRRAVRGSHLLIGIRTQKAAGGAVCHWDCAVPRPPPLGGLAAARSASHELHQLTWLTATCRPDGSQNRDGSRDQTAPRPRLYRGQRRNKEKRLPVDVIPALCPALYIYLCSADSVQLPDSLAVCLDSRHGPRAARDMDATNRTLSRNERN